MEATRTLKHNGSPDNDDPHARGSLNAAGGQLTEHLRWRAELEAERRQLAEAIGVTDQEILDDLQAFGYTRETIALLHLAPLVQVAWAEGRITKRERLLIHEAARLRGIEEGTEAFERLKGWLDFAPTEEFCEKSMSLIRAMLHTLPPEGREASKLDLVALCLRVAEASAGERGFASGGLRVCDEEVELIRRITAELSREKSQEMVERVNLSEATGITDGAILRELQRANFTPDTVRLLPLVPLVEVAWAEGNVTRSERRIIAAAARLRGIRAGSAAYDRLMGMLDERPSDELFNLALRAVRAIIGVLPEEMREVDEMDLLAYCAHVAEASGIDPTFTEAEGKICDEERKLLDRIAIRIKSERPAMAVTNRRA